MTSKYPLPALLSILFALSCKPPKAIIQAANTSVTNQNLSLPTLTFPNGSTVDLAIRPERTILLDEKGCKIILESPKILVFNRINAPGRSVRNSFDSPFTIHVPFGDSLLLVMCGGPIIELYPGSSLEFMPSDAYHPTNRHSMFFSGNGFFDFWDKYMLVTPHGRIFSAPSNFSIREFSFIVVDNDSMGDGCMIVNWINSSVVNYFRKKQVLPPGSDIYYTPKGGRIWGPIIDSPRYHHETIDHGAFQMGDQTAPMILRDMVSWWGLKGFSCGKGIDTTQKGGLGGGRISRSSNLYSLQKLHGHFPIVWDIRNDSLLVSMDSTSNGL